MRRPLSVAAQLATSFGLLLVVLAMVSMAAWLGLGRTNAFMNTLYDDRVVPLGQLAEVQRTALRDRILVMDMIRNPEAANIAKRSKEIEANRSLAGKLWEAYVGTYLTPEEKSLVDQHAAAHKAYIVDGIEAAAKKLQAGDVDGANELAGKGISAAAPAYTGLLEELLALQVRVADEIHGESQASFGRLKAVFAAACAAGLALGLAAAAFITRRLTRQLGAEPVDLCDMSNAIASGDLGRSHTAAAVPGSVMDAMQRMRGSLVEVVTTVRSGVDNVASASAQISLGNSDLSSRTEQQASSLQQTAASVEQLTGTVSSSSENARQALALSQDASTAAADGAEIVKEVVKTMNDIAERSRKIGDITSVIDSISFQTNILALNAAVEAARAGEQGRGFSVVAAEVRVLAQRSAQAAKEIKSLINSSNEVVESGNARAETAGRAMQAITERVGSVTTLISELSAAAGEQSDGIGQINQAISSIDQATQSNAALVEESAAAADSLKSQAERLANAVATFRLPQAA